MLQAKKHVFLLCFCGFPRVKRFNNVQFDATPIPGPTDIAKGASSGIDGTVRVKALMREPKSKQAYEAMRRTLAAWGGRPEWLRPELSPRTASA
jgi:hypothetical protein